MTKDQDNNHITEPPLCIGCGRPMTKGTGFCRECAERGLSPCEACEGLSLLDVEEGGND